MSNILQHNRKIFDVKIDKSDYWDFHLCVDNVGSSTDANECLAVDIDINESDCVWFDEIYSKSDVIWEDATSTDITLNSIGFTGVDNGLFKYEKDRITNKEFLDIYFNSQYQIFADDKRLKLTKVSGNNQIYDYQNDIVILDEENIQCARLNGGFYQGFFKLDGYDYQVLPTSMKQKGWKFSFTLKKEDFHNDNVTLNEKYPENKGIFFFIGTRAENKWYKKYTINNENVIETCIPHYNIDNYSENYIEKNNVSSNLEYQIPEEMTNEGEYFDDGYVKKNDYFNAESDCCNYYAEEEYIEKDEKLPDENKLKTEEGYDLYQPNIIEYKTDNKFLTYNRTKNGFLASDDVEDTEVILYDIKVPNMENYFLLFNRTDNGITTENIDEIIAEKNKEYNLIEDIYRNALAFQITDDGKIGYKYFIKDCENENGYIIESEFSNSGNIVNDIWYDITVSIEPIKNTNNKCQNSSEGKMRLYFYVNGKLVMVSKILPILMLKRLNDLSSKQQGVPYNISLGGGTQGLCDVIYVDYMNEPSDILPIEREFAGTFIGYIRNFRFYNCK